MERVECPICGVDDSRPWGEEYRGHRIVVCDRCGLRYVNPRRTAAENRTFYDHDYFERDRHREREKRELVAANAERSVATVLRHAPDRKLDVLDVGCGRGNFLQRIKERGAVRTVAGTDLTGANAEILARRGIDFRVGDILDLDLPRFDVVTAHHVLEHVMRPDLFLERIRGILPDDGIVHLVLPNEGSAHSRWKSFLSRRGVKRTAFKHLAAHHHLFFYERKTLDALLVSVGFEVVSMGTTASAKHRGPLDRLLHGLLDRARLNTWLECVATPVERERGPRTPDRLSPPGP